jgi:hypothetical protein
MATDGLGMPASGCSFPLPAFEIIATSPTDPDAPAKIDDGVSDTQARLVPFGHLLPSLRRWKLRQ